MGCECNKSQEGGEELNNQRVKELGKIKYVISKKKNF